MQPDPTQDGIAYYKAILHDLIDMGASLARIVHDDAKRQAEANAAALPPIAAANDRLPDSTIAFDRIARTVRRTVLLAQKLGEPPRAGQHQHRIATRKRILRAVEDTIDREAKPADRGALRAELLDRLDSPDLEDDIDTRPLEAIVLDICRDLQVEFPANAWKRRTPADIAALRTTAAALPPAWNTPAWNYPSRELPQPGTPQHRIPDPGPNPPPPNPPPSPV